MKKYCLLVLALLNFAFVFSQETQIRRNENHLFDEGKDLFTQQKYGAARRAFEGFIAKENSSSGIYVEAVYYLNCIAFELKEDRSADMLKDFVKQYPYYPMNYMVNYMLGIIYFEKGKLKQATSYLEKIEPSELNRKDVKNYYFANGVCLVEQKEYQKARTNFLNVQNSEEYGIDAEYYAAYCDYCMGNYGAALRRFENCRNTKYEEAASYHILQIYDRTDNPAQAVALGKSLVDKYPKSENNTEVYRILGEASFEQKNYQDAVNYLKKYEESTDKVIREDMYMLGMALYYTGKYDDAVKYLSKTTSKQDTLAENAYFTIGQGYLKLDDKNRAKMAFQQASSTNFDSKIREEALYNYALLSYETGSVFGESINALNSFLTEFPNSAHKNDAHNLLASSYIQDRNYIAALNSINEIKNPSAKMVQAKEYILFQLGVQEFDSKQYANAENYFSQSIKLYSPQSFSAQAYLWRGETCFRAKNYDKSRSDLKMYLASKQAKEQSDIDKANYTVGYSYFNEEQFDNAREWFLRYTQNTNDKKSPTYYDALNRIGDSYFNRRDFASAMNNYSKVIEGNPRLADYSTYQAGIIKGLQKNYQGKIAEMQKLIKNYPSSNFAPNAMYEMGRSYVMQNRYQDAINSYNVILSKYPKNSIARKAALETGILYENMGQNQNAITAYKNVVDTYPGSEQTNVAMQSLQSLYVETNDVASYVSYKQSLGDNIATSLTVSQEDSLTFIAAEKIYAKGSYSKAIPSLKNYTDRFCKNTSLNCINANYYLADSYDNIKDTANAYQRYDYLTKIEGNRYMERALIRAADIVYTEKNYERAVEYFTQLKQTTGNGEVKDKAQLGILRCYYQEKSYEQVIDNATIVLKNSPAFDVEKEARYCRAKSLIALYNWADAVQDLNYLSQDVIAETGAEARYLLAQHYYNQNDYQKSEDEIMDFIGKKSPYQYWIARSFVLLSDVYVAKQDYFQAKQYLLSLQENYHQDDDIASMITDRLTQINQHEKEEIY
ncbi:MAG: tetratricopeptide repeat protein [Prevotellaceae bacterium]|jgi:tol-pal system protein YbgF|nr:tetratricopeptide repeat protein [Prevotellaceae bacterium]